jgi:hypothetical protein
MRIISWDIGTRNLAYCILEGTNRSNVRIISWDLIDIMAESAGHDSPKCFKCRKPANWLKDDSYSCTLHKGKIVKPPTKKTLNSKSLEELTTEAQKLQIVGTSKKVLVDSIYAKYKSNVWTRCIKSSKSGNVVELSLPISQCLEARKEIWKDADKIVLEQQPDKRMLVVQAMIHMWFVCAGFKCAPVSAVHKLSNIVTLEDHTKTYKGRKKTGIVHATQLVPPQWKEYLLKHPKKDDLADCFLQGLWCVENMRL